MNLPNKITMSRICLIPVFAVIFLLDVIPYNYLIACAVFVVAACTDFIDGHIARSRGLVTNLGKFLDPIADKVLVSTALILLLTRMEAFWQPFVLFGGDAARAASLMTVVAGVCVALILARELIVSGFRMIAAGRGIVLAADKLGKIKTVFQDLSIALILAGMAFIGSRGGEIVVIIGIFCFFICTALTVISGVNYIVRNKQVLSEEAQA